MPNNTWPSCQHCDTGVLLPLSDYGPEGANLLYKVWGCHNPECGFYFRIQKGQVSADQLPRAPHRISVDSRRP